MDAGREAGGPGRRLAAMSVLAALLGVLILALIPALAAPAGAQTLFTLVLPGLALVVFVLGIIWRVVVWARTPVPFKITTTCGQQQSLSWIDHAKLDCPQTKTQTFWRMVLEILLFRSLFRNTRAGRTREGDLVYGANKYLWLGAIVFHYSFLVVILRHLRFFTEPVPAPIHFLENVDGFFQIGLPGIYITSFTLVIALGYLLYRRLADAQVRYLSLAADYFALFLLLGIALSGIVMRHTALRTDIVEVKALAMGIWTLTPVAITGASWLFYVHLFLVSVLLAYFPFSKLMHAGGIFLSPTRNMANDNRQHRYVNPWAGELPNRTHSYAEWEEEFADVMKAAGYKLDRQ
jgi:nitrate reductase gamma subunit